jgi:hypothetical protein
VNLNSIVRAGRLGGDIQNVHALNTSSTYFDYLKRLFLSDIPHKESANLFIASKEIAGFICGPDNVGHIVWLVLELVSNKGLIC